MSSPLTENGHVRIANELFDAILAFGFSKRQLTVLLAVLRKTYGYGKKTDDMTVQQLADLTSIPRQHVSTTLSELHTINAVLKQDGKYGYVLGINKNYRGWRPSQNGTCPKTGRRPSQNGTLTVPKRDTQKTLSKDTINRHTLNGAFSRFWDAYPKKRSKGQAEKAWLKLKPSPDLAEQICQAVDRAKTQADWRKANGQYVPYPATWLNAKGWEDEMPDDNVVRIRGNDLGAPPNTQSLVLLCTGSV